jgi:hypothetical protein
MKTKRCWKCNRKIGIDQDFCPFCGALNLNGNNMKKVEEMLAEWMVKKLNSLTNSHVFRIY